MLYFPQNADDILPVSYLSSGSFAAVGGGVSITYCSPKAIAQGVTPNFKEGIS